MVEKNPGPNAKKKAAKNKNNNNAKQNPVNPKALKLKVDAVKSKVVVPKPKTSLYKKSMEEFIKNILLVEKPFVLPRDVSTNVAVKHFAYTKPINPDPDQDKGCIIVRPNPDNFISLGKAEDKSETVVTKPEGDAEYSWNSTPGALISADMSAILNDGTVIKCSTATGGTAGMHFSNAQKKLVNGLKYYPGAFNVDGANNTTVSVKNTSSSNLSFSLVLGHIDKSGNAITDAEGATTAVPAGSIVTGKQIGRAHV